MTRIRKKDLLNNANGASSSCCGVVGGGVMAAAETATTTAGGTSLLRAFMAVAALCFVSAGLFHMDDFHKERMDAKKKSTTTAALTPERLLAQIQRQQQQMEKGTVRLRGGGGGGGGDEVRDIRIGGNVGGGSSDNDADEGGNGKNNMKKESHTAKHAEKLRRIPEPNEKQERGGDGGGKKGGQEQKPQLKKENDDMHKDDTNRPRRFEMKLAKLKSNDDGDGDGGTVVFETRPSWAPLGVSHFHDLVSDSIQFYDDCRFFRVVPNFVVQFGIAASPETQKKYGQGKPIQDDPVLHSNVRGIITYATSGKNSRTTQLFVNTNKSNPKGNAFLDGQGFAPVAEIISGMEYVDRINDEYREKPAQGKIVRRGNEYLDKEFPNLSYIESIREIEVPDMEQQEEAEHMVHEEAQKVEEKEGGQ